MPLLSGFLRILERRRLYSEHSKRLKAMGGELSGHASFLGGFLTVACFNAVVLTAFVWAIDREWRQAMTARFFLSEYPNHTDFAQSDNDPPSSSANEERLQGVRNLLFLDHRAPDDMYQALPNIQAQPFAFLQARASSAILDRSNMTVADDTVSELPVPSGLDAQPSATASIMHWRSTVGSRLGKSVLSAYRNSLIAVDNETGDIVGVLAENVQLGGNQEASSSDEEQEATTPDQDDGPEWVMADGSRARSSIIRPASRYVDLDDERVRPPSRAASVLREDTFAPPPIPSKIRDLS
jgi:hypothetical protein